MILIILPSYVFGQPHTARKIMEMVDERDDGDRSISDMKMLLIDRNGSRRNRSLRTFGIDQGDDRYSIMFFLSPGDVRGTGFMSYDYDKEGKDDDQWLFLPALKKVKRIAFSDKSGSFMGSDFSYADLTKRCLEDYTYAFYKKKPEVEVYGKKCRVIESLPKAPDVIDKTGYVKSILFVRQDIHVIVRAIHYLEDNSIKYYDIKRLARIDGIWTALEIHMTRKKGKKTVHQTILTRENVAYNRESVNASLFTTRYLEKGL
ncbi:MAG: outer membrane lipoprotein-sorting protein [Desulfobacter sp.]|nr:outer membrane lipoprotein-sorting protein [Desulfobacter sp.]WDP85289.1 MAG: outer membrane lipoprotein-sorting protein [Desulfobacter sp.]